MGALLTWARGDLRRLDGAVALARLDWRDRLVEIGLADADWAARLGDEFGEGAAPA